MTAQTQNYKKMAKKMLTVEEAARHMGVSKSNLYQLIHRRAIPHYKPNGKMVYFNRLELDKWLQRNRVELADGVTNNQNQEAQ